MEERQRLLQEMFAEIGENCWIGAGAVILLAFPSETTP